MRRLRNKLPLIATVAGIVAASLLYVFGLAYLQSRPGAGHSYTFEQLIIPRLTDLTIFFWSLYFGAAIGSFLNVVAWRMPRGEGITGSSKCPRCANKLKAKDNFPVLGWISLRGRCRFCGLPISSRYPIVEAVVGISIAMITMSQLYALALPGQYKLWTWGPIWAPRITTPVIVTLSYHMVGLSTLWAMALIRLDGTRLPASILRFAAVALILPMLVYPTLMVVPWQTSRPPEWDADDRYFDALMRVITALVAGALFGRVLARGLCPRADLKLDPLGGDTSRLVDLIAMLSIPAVLLGWQSMPAFVILAAVVTLIVRPFADRIPINDGPRGQLESRDVFEYFSLALPIALTIHLTLWRALWCSGFWPSDESSRTVIIAWALATLLVPLCLRAKPPAEKRDADDGEERLDKDDETESADELPDDQREAESDEGDQRRDDSPSL